MIPPGTTLGDRNRYRVVRHLGVGGMGTVYEAHDDVLANVVALKECHFVEEDQERLRRQFEREAKILAKLKHPAITRVTDHFQQGSRHCLVMDFVGGEDLTELLKSQGRPFDVDRVVRWGEQLLDALEYLHSQSAPIIHRDIKPQNLKLATQNQIILLDFGLAKDSAPTTTRIHSTGSIFGYTPNYAPLEQMQGSGTDPRSDLYSLSATLYHLVTAAIPVDVLSRVTAVTDGQPDPLQSADEKNPLVPAGVGQVLARGMSIGKNQRYQSAADMRTALVTAWATRPNAAAATPSITPVSATARTVVLVDPVTTREAAPSVPEQAPTVMLKDAVTRRDPVPAERAPIVAPLIDHIAQHPVPASAQASDDPEPVAEAAPAAAMTASGPAAAGLGRAGLWLYAIAIVVGLLLGAYEAHSTIGDQPSPVPGLVLVAAMVLGFAHPRRCWIVGSLLAAPAALAAASFGPGGWAALIGVAMVLGGWVGSWQARRPDGLANVLAAVTGAVAFFVTAALVGHVDYAASRPDVVIAGPAIFLLAGISLGRVPGSSWQSAFFVTAVPIVLILSAPELDRFFAIESQFLPFFLILVAAPLALLGRWIARRPTGSRFAQSWTYVTAVIAIVLLLAGAVKFHEAALPSGVAFGVLLGAANRRRWWIIAILLSLLPATAAVFHVGRDELGLPTALLAIGSLLGAWMGRALVEKPHGRDIVAAIVSGEFALLSTLMLVTPRSVWSVRYVTADMDSIAALTYSGEGTAAATMAFLLAGGILGLYRPVAAWWTGLFTGLSIVLACSTSSSPWHIGPGASIATVLVFAVALFIPSALAARWVGSRLRRSSSAASMEALAAPVSAAETPAC